MYEHFRHERPSSRAPLGTRQYRPFFRGQEQSDDFWRERWWHLRLSSDRVPHGAGSLQPRHHAVWHRRDAVCLPWRERTRPRGQTGERGGLPVQQYAVLGRMSAEVGYESDRTLCPGGASICKFHKIFKKLEEDLFNCKFLTVW